MMKADSCRISAYIDGELGPEESAQVEKHLESCADCRELLADYRQQKRDLSKAGGGLLLHLDIARLVREKLPDLRRSLVMIRTRGVRRQFALAGFGVALVLALFSFFYPGARHVLTRLSQPKQMVFFMNWAFMFATGSLLVWPEKIAWLESKFLSFLSGGTPRVNARDRALVQGLGLAFLCLSTLLHLMLISNKYLPF
jgi:Putative zinc-finger